MTEFHVIDMDLDVIRTADRGVFIDDQDEFAEHSVSMRYPQQLIEDIQAAADGLYHAVKAQQAPFDGTDVEWFTEGRK